MGTYLNPGNGMFRDHRKSRCYVDKSGLIKYTNECITYNENKYLCVSRPRRFGKTMAADMLTAYYGRGCDSHAQFQGLAIANSESYEQYINKFNAVHVNVTEIVSGGKDVESGLDEFESDLVDDIRKEHKRIKYKKADLVSVLKETYEKTGIKFVFIIDEWDCVFREKKDKKAEQETYLKFLRDLLKDKEYVALAYMTGILPIKKYGTHSALNMFNEISMLDASPLQEYTGFTSDEVKRLCERYGRSYDDIKEWYDGYNVDGVEIYNPFSVVSALTKNTLKSYWTKTETYEDLERHINSNKYGVQDVLCELLKGKPVTVDTAGFQNDMVTFNGRNDVLTLLVHLGYLSYDCVTKEIRIPNHELYLEFVTSMGDVGLGNVDLFIKRSEALLDATLAGREREVAGFMEEIHDGETSPIDYNSEISLTYVVKMAYFAAMDHYSSVREMPAGKGYADIAYIPAPGQTNYPPMIVELKVDGTKNKAMNQIVKRNYANFLSGYHGDVVLVGISYDKKRKGHSCRIQRVVR